MFWQDRSNSKVSPVPVNIVPLVKNFYINLAYGYDAGEFNKNQEMTTHINSDLTTSNESSFMAGIQNISLNNSTIQNIANEINTNVRMHYVYSNGVTYDDIHREYALDYNE